MSTTLEELHQRAREYYLARQAKEDAMTRFNRAIYEWDKAVEYAEKSVMNKYFASVEFESVDKIKA